MKFSVLGDCSNKPLGGVCSIQLSYWDIYKFYAIFKARRNRTICRLGEPRYIHLTKETNAVFPGFFALLAPAAIIYNSNTFVMNYLFLISSDFSDFASLSDPQTLPFFFKRVPSWFYLRRRVLYPAELYGRVWYMIIARPRSNCNPLFSFFEVTVVTQP